MDRGAWQTTVHGVSKSQTRLSDIHFHFQNEFSSEKVLNSSQNHIILEESKSELDPWGSTALSLLRGGWGGPGHLNSPDALSDPGTACHQPL